jgi:phosphatidylinositol 4-kinase
MKCSRIWNLSRFFFNLISLNFCRPIQKDASQILQCLTVVTHKVFAIYLECAQHRPNDDQLERELETHAQFLLIKFNHIDKEV